MSIQPDNTHKWDTAIDGSPLQVRRRPRSSLGAILGGALTLSLTSFFLVPLAMSHVRTSQLLGFVIEVAIYAAALFIFYRIFDAVVRRAA
jgi:hypothetical protein